MIVNSLRTGCYFSIAAQAAGIPAPTAEEWRRRGEGRDHRAASPVFLEFAAACARAEAEAELFAGAAVRQAIPQDGRLALEFLRRRYPDRWGRERSEVTITRADAGLSDIPDDLLDAELSRRLTDLRRIEADDDSGVAR